MFVLSHCTVLHCVVVNLWLGAGLDFGMLVKSCLCLGIFFTYPVMMFPVIKILEAYLLPDLSLIHISEPTRRS